MTASSKLARIGGSGAIVAMLLCSVPARGLAQDQYEAPEKEAPERPELPPLTAQLSPEEALAAIKRRAQKILEARRAARRLKVYTELTQGLGYETNPANASPHKGDTYLEESAYLLLSKKLTPTLDWQGSYYATYLKYLDFGDLDYTDHTLTPVKLRWQPGRMWRVESWMDLEYLYYPLGKDSSYRGLKSVSRIRQNLFESWYHQIQYEWFVRDYATKNARDGAGAETLSNRVDTRNRLRYKVGTTVRKALLSVENDLYWHDSNDGRNDFYDSEVWKITGSASGSVTPKLYLSGSFAFERKNYKERPVTGLVAPARYDDKYTLSSSASYDLNKTWKCAYALTFDHLASNESTGEFDNTKHALTVTARF